MTRVDVRRLVGNEHDGIGVPYLGYRWDRSEGEPRLLENEPGEPSDARHGWAAVDSRGQWKLYVPDDPGSVVLFLHYDQIVDDPRLCETFAAIRHGDEDAILAFANFYGTLGLGTPISLWNESIAKVAAALGLVRAIASRSAVRLQDWIEWRDGRAHLDIRQRGARVRLGPHDSFFVRFTEAGDYRAAARAFAQTLIGEGLREHTHCVLLDSESDCFELHVGWRGLLGMIWYQVARLAEGGVEHRKCAAPGCPNYLLIGAAAGGHSKNRTVCSERCKKAAQRAIATPKRRTPTMKSARKRSS